MQIKSSLYNDLTLATRIKAALAATARDDTTEIQRIVKTCPKKTYIATDTDFSETMQMLFCFSMSLECDKRGYVLSFLLALRTGDPKGAKRYLVKLASLQAAWEKFLLACGIDFNDMQQAGAPMHPYLELIENIAVAEDDLTERYYQELWENFPYKNVFCPSTQMQK